MKSKNADGDRIRVKQRGLPVEIKTPTEMSKKELDIFEELVVEGREIDPNNYPLKYRIRRATFLAYVLDGSQMVAVGDIKTPTDRHKNDIARQSKLELGIHGTGLATFKGELGYIAVKPTHQGLHPAQNFLQRARRSGEVSLWPRTYRYRPVLPCVLQFVKYRSFHHKLLWERERDGHLFRHVQKRTGQDL